MLTWNDEEVNGLKWMRDTHLKEYPSCTINFLERD